MGHPDSELAATFCRSLVVALCRCSQHGVETGERGGVAKIAGIAGIAVIARDQKSKDLGRWSGNEEQQK